MEELPTIRPESQTWKSRAISLHTLAMGYAPKYLSENADGILRACASHSAWDESTAGGRRGASDSGSGNLSAAGQSLVPL